MGIDPFALGAGEGERLRFSDADFLIRASAESTDGAFSLIEEIDPLDTPLHVHEREDEIFYVLEGEHIVQVGDQEFELGPGDLAFGPRGVPHSQRRVVPRTGRILIMYSPAGFEGFFRELAQADGPDDYARASAKYGVTWL